MSKQSNNELCDTFFTFYFYFDAVKTSHCSIIQAWQIQQGAKNYYCITINVLYIYYCFFFFSFIDFFSPFLKQSRQILFEKLKQDWCKHFLIKEAFWWNLSPTPNLVWQEFTFCHSELVFKFEQCTTETICLLCGLHCCHIDHSIHGN